MEKRFFVIARYNIESITCQERVIYQSCINKINYIFDVFKRSGIKFEIISASNSSNKIFLPSKLNKIDELQTLRLLCGFRFPTKLGIVLGNYMFLIQLFLFLLLKIKKSDILYVYHSVFYLEVIKYIVAIKKCKLIIEAEEVFGDVCDNGRMRKKELNYFPIASVLISPTEYLLKTINQKSVPSCVVHGTYKCAPTLCQPLNDGKIHVVYAGTFDPQKGGLLAVESAAYLNNHFCFHICGGGTEAQTSYVKQRIQEVNNRNGALVMFHGMLKGSDFIELLQQCHIGLSPQDPTAKFNKTSFPSKILSYLSNGLRVLSIDIPAIKNSDVGCLLFYYDKQTPEVIASSLLQIDIKTDYDSKALLNKLDKAFLNNFNCVYNQLIM